MSQIVSSRGCESWLSEKLNIGFTERARGLMAVAGLKILGMVVFDRWTDTAGEVSVAAEVPTVWRKMLREGFHYFFITCEKEVLIATIRSDNLRSLRFAERRLGMSPIAKIVDGAARGVDMIIFELRKENCRWLTEEERRNVGVGRRGQGLE